MAWALQSNWNPTRILEIAGSADTSTGATEVTTDAGRAYIKPLGNRQGPHVLATDWVGTHLAKWFGLTTFDIAILTLQDDDVFDLPRGAKAAPGPAFAAQAMSGDPWGRSGLQLDVLVNPEDITRMVIFDTWTLNCDRYHPDRSVRRPNYDNVYLSSEGVETGKRWLIAMDHGLCFIRSGEDLTSKLAHIAKVKDERIYGLFPEFRARLDEDMIEDCLARLHELDVATAAAMIETIPSQWDVSISAREAWNELICHRAVFVAENFQEWIDKAGTWFGAGG